MHIERMAEQGKVVLYPNLHLVYFVTINSTLLSLDISFPLIQDS